MFYLKRKIEIKKRGALRGRPGEYRTIMLGEFRRIEQARAVMKLMTDYGAGYGLYVHTPREETMAYLLQREVAING